MNSQAWIKWLKLLSFTLLLTSLSSCASQYTIDPGVWELSVKGRKFNITEPGFNPSEIRQRPLEVLIEGLTVDVALKWVEEGDAETEVVIIRFLPKDDSDEETERKEAATPLKGTITFDEKENLVLDVIGSDRKFKIQLIGNVSTPRLVKGGFYAYDEHTREEGREGTFILRKVKDQ